VRFTFVGALAGSDLARLGCLGCRSRSTPWNASGVAVIGAGDHGRVVVETVTARHPPAGCIRVPGSTSVRSNAPGPPSQLRT